uniref:hypothetical protein n=1 Tax=Pseudomonas huaxiensis TaxID=2213017 RepID=UPI000DA6C8E0
MYFLERGFQWSKALITYEEAMNDFNNQQRQPGQAELHAPEGIKESVSDRVHENSSIYSHKENYIDVRTPNDEKRGVITFFASWIYGMIIYSIAINTTMSIDYAIAGHSYYDEIPLTNVDLFFAVLFPLLWMAVLAIFLKYTLRFTRLEAFTARRIIVRFNRITRKVYLLRPKHLGGIRIMDWDKTEILIDKKMSELEGTGGFVILVWDKGDGVDLEGTPTD